MRLFRRRDALLIGAALVLGCAMSMPRSGSSEAEEQPCTVSSLQLARASERTLYDVMERLCPSLTFLQRNGREVRAFIVHAGDPATPLGGATALRLFRPADIARVRFFPQAGDDQSAVALVLVELRAP